MTALEQAYSRFPRELADDLDEAIERTLVEYEAVPEGFDDEEKTMPVHVDVQSLKRSPGARREVHRHLVRR